MSKFNVMKNLIFMKTYIFNHTENSNIKIIIEAYNYTQAMELLLSVTRDIELYELQRESSPSLSDFSRK